MPSLPLSLFYKSYQIGTERAKSLKFLSTKIQVFQKESLQNYFRFRLAPNFLRILFYSFQQQKILFDLINVGGPLQRIFKRIFPVPLQKN